MKFFDTGPHAVGIIAIGQEATGVIALGQAATGVIAIGQMARGCFAVGQLAIGFVGWGQLGAGVFHAAGMVGVGGRRGIGLVVPLVPSLGKKRVPPPTTTFAAVHAGQEGWLAVQLGVDAIGLGLFENGMRMPIKLDRRLQSGASAIVNAGPQPTWAYTKRIGSQLVCQKIAYDPPRPYQKRGFWQLGALQFVGLLGLASGWWMAAGNDLLAHLRKIGEDEARPVLSKAASVPAVTAPKSLPPTPTPTPTPRPKRPTGR